MGTEKGWRERIRERLSAADAAAAATDPHPIGPASSALPRRDYCAACTKALRGTQRLCHPASLPRCATRSGLRRAEDDLRVGHLEFHFEFLLPVSYHILPPLPFSSLDSSVISPRDPWCLAPFFLLLAPLRACLLLPGPFLWRPS